MDCMKKLLAGFFTLSLMLSTACSQNLPTSEFLDQGLSEVSAQARNNVRSDWFESLRPELQSYYAPARGKTGAALFDALHNIISSNQKVFEYGEAKSFMYDKVGNKW